MLTSVLIANRGEIACRIIRTAKRLGKRTIAVYSDADANAQHVRLADEAYHIGPAAAGDSYLAAAKIVAVAQAAGAACLHPGYGFLAENADFAEACAAAGIVFVGPPPSAMRAMGLKDGAKALMQNAGVPVVPGYHGRRQDSAFLQEKADEIGYPVLIKAVAGGGGKGMRRVDAHADFEAALESAQREAQSAFGNPRVLIEKYILAPRHIEVQIFADHDGNTVHLFERDCSLQRRHQKVIEEAPAPGMTHEVRAAMGAAAVEAAKAVSYVGAGTVEFIADGRQGLRTDGFYFMEMNTRLQVEHPVTEAITGLDLVEMQFRVADGEPIVLRQADVVARGHAVEARLYAEDPENDFLPSTGLLRALTLPAGEGVRVDTGVAEDDTVSPFYDPMIAKIVAHGATRLEALDRLTGALGQTIVMGPKCNVAFLKALCEADAFRAGHFDTSFIDRNRARLGAVRQPLDGQAVAAGVMAALDRIASATVAQQRSGGVVDAWDILDAFQFSGQRRTLVPVAADGEKLEAFRCGAWTRSDPLDASVIAIPALDYQAAPVYAAYDDLKRRPFNPQSQTLVMDSDRDILVFRRGRQTSIRLVDPLDTDDEQSDSSDGAIKAPMHGKLVALFVKPGEAVEKGQRIAVVEAMKMEHTLVAPMAGTVTEVAADQGAQVSQGAKIVVIQETGVRQGAAEDEGSDGRPPRRRPL